MSKFGDESEFDRFLEILAPIAPAIVPLQPGKKIPAVRWKDIGSGVRVQDFHDTEARAILTGPRSGGIFVIDVDIRAGGLESLERLENEHGALPQTLTVRSPTGGIHIYLVHPNPSGVRSVGGYRPGIDLRGAGGIAVVPGSVHPKGGIYRIEDVP